MLSRSHQVALVDERSDRVLTVPGDNGHRLVTFPGRWPDHGDLVAAVGCPSAEPAGPPVREEDGTVTTVLVSGGPSALSGAVWWPLSRLDELHLPGDSAAGLRRTLRERRDGPPDDGRAAWFRPGWREDVVAWVDRVLASVPDLERDGEPELVKAWSLSAVLRVPVRRAGVRADLWCKATCEGFRAEPALTAAVRWLAPALAPRVVAADPDRAWLLMEEIPGADLGAPPERAADVARHLARLQLASLPVRETLVAAGAPARGLEATLGMLDEVLHRSVDVLPPDLRARAPSLRPWLERSVRELWDGAVPDTLCHGDLHLGNVSWVGDGPVLFDWTDACLTHPFLDARHLADSAAAEIGDDGDREATRAAVRAAYLEVWRPVLADVDLDAVWERARVPGLVFQAITFEQIYRAQPETSRWELATVVADLLGTLLELHARC